MPENSGTSAIPCAIPIVNGFKIAPAKPICAHTQVVNQLREHFQDMVFNTIIQRNIRLSEAPSHGKPIVLYDIMSNGSSNYLKLAREVMERNEPQAQTL